MSLGAENLMDDQGWSELTRAAKNTIAKVRDAMPKPSHDEEIRETAYSIWQEEGCPDGRHVEHWLKAEAIWQARQAATRADTQPSAKAKPARKKTAAVDKSQKPYRKTQSHAPQSALGTQRKNAVAGRADRRSMTRRSIFAIFLGTFSLSGCVLAGPRSPVDAELQGRVENNVYTSPQQFFRIRIPQLSANSALRDERPTPNTMLVSIKDDLCREFVVSERPGFLSTQSLQSWVDEHIVEDLKRRHLDVQSKPVTTRAGAAISLRYRAPAAAPCTQTTEVDGKPVVAKRDADVGWYVYHRDGAFYRLIYVVGIGPGTPSSWYVNREPVDEVLAQFAEGFEILDAQNQPAR